LIWFTFVMMYRLAANAPPATDQGADRKANQQPRSSHRWEPHRARSAPDVRETLRCERSRVRAQHPSPVVHNGSAPPYAPAPTTSRDCQDKQRGQYKIEHDIGSTAVER
jgi:hypothetical protein